MFSMSALAAIIITLLLSPIGILASHAAAFRVLRAARCRPTAHTSAIVGIAGWFVVVAAMTWQVSTAASADALSRLCLVAYVGAVYAALAVLYLDIVNIAETSLHMHLLLEIAWGDRPSLSALVDRYSPRRMVAERLDRLAALGQVRVVDGRYQLANRSTLALSRALDVWRRVLGLPTSPDEAAAR